jgi:CBS domain-containing protein
VQKWTLKGKLFVKYDITGLPVVADDMTLVGIISEKDVLRLLYKKKDEKGKTVGDFLTEHVISFDEDANLQDICDCLLLNPFRRIPVTSGGMVIGIISRPDIIRHILASWGTKADSNLER